MTDLGIRLHNLRRVDGGNLTGDLVALAEALELAAMGAAEALDGTGFAVDAATVVGVDNGATIAALDSLAAEVLPPAEAAAADQARRRAWHEDPTA